MTMKEAFTFGAVKDTVVIWRNGLPFAQMAWEFALELGRAYQEAGRAAKLGEEFYREICFQGERRTAVTAGDRVLMLSNGVVVNDQEAELAIEIGNAMIGAAHRAEEYSKVDQVIADQALMMRAGGKVSLSGNRDINAEAWRTAECDPVLRKNMPTPTSIPSRERFGYPRVRRGPLKSAADVLDSATDPLRRALKRVLK